MKRFTPFAWFALVVACFALTRPYFGVVHDGILYAAQALALSDPLAYRDDIYFSWGSQDRYTLFSPLFAGLAGVLGLATAHLVLVVIALAAFLCASFALVRALVPAGLRGPAMLLIAATGGHYGPQPIFRMAEAFVSPRPLAEAGTLLALLLLFRGQRAWALGLLAACALLHPLVALAGLVYWWIYMLLDGARRPWLLAMPLIPVAGALAGLGPLGQLFEVFDSEWFDVVFDINRHLFVTRWTWFDWSRVGFDLAALFVAARLSDGLARSAFRAALWTALAVLGMTFVGADVLHNVLITNLQPWRALWIVHWLALAAIPIAVSRLWLEGGTARLVAGLLVFALVTRGTPSSFGAAALSAALFAGRADAVLRPALVRAVLALLAAGALWAWISGEWRALTDPRYLADAARFPLVLALTKALPLLAVAAVIAWFISRRPAALAAGALLALALASWDQRPAFARYVESVPPGAHPFSAVVKPGEDVWWDGESLGHNRALLMPWILMKRASYHSTFQYAGQHYHRGVSLELRRRRDIVLPYTFQAGICEWMDKVDAAEKCLPEFDAVQAICRDAPALDYLVLETDYPLKWVAQWALPVPVGERSLRYYLYACKSIRAG